MFRIISIAIGAAALLFAPTHVARAADGDLLVAPTRVVLDGRRGAEVVMNNIGAAPASYRVSLELRRMNAEGRLEPVTTPAAAEAAALDMIAYAPRRVTLQPNQPQAIRIGVRPPEGLAPGEYRVHMLFRAIPEARPANAAAGPSSGVAIALTPIYGVTIPVIVRNGELSGGARISNARVDGGSVAFDLGRTGSRSLYGDVRLVRAGGKPELLARGVAIYPEIPSRRVSVRLDRPLTGAAILQYAERPEDGGRILAEAPIGGR